MKRGIRLAIGLLAVSSLAVFGLSATSSQEATPPPIGTVPDGVSVNPLAFSPNITLPEDTPFSVGVGRYVYESGVAFELNYYGPVLYYVEKGELAILSSDDRNLIYISSWNPSDPSPEAIGNVSGNVPILRPGQSVYSEDGRLGPTRNAGSGKLVVLALLVVPNPGGGTWAVTGDPNATPMNN